MHVRSPVVEPHLGSVPSLVVVVAHMEGHVQTLDEVDQEPKSETSILDRPGWIFQRCLKLMDLVHDATLLGHVSREPGIVTGLVQRNIDVVPGSGSRQPATVLVGPCRCVQRCFRLLRAGA